MKFRILLALIIFPILLFLCALSLMWMPLPQPFPVALSGERNQMAAILTGVMGFIFVIGLGVYTISAFLKTGRFLDAVLEKMGFSSKSYMLFGRKYQGFVDGREVKVDFVPARWPMPRLLNIYVNANLGTRLAAGFTRPLLDCRDGRLLENTGGELGNLQVYAQEKESANRLLADSNVQISLMRLLDKQKELGFREIYLQPEQIWLRAHPRQMTGEIFWAWLDAMLKLAKACEK